MRTKKIKIHAVSIDVDETATHWVVYVSPQIYAQSLGITPHRAKLAKCLCVCFSGQGNRCRWCGNWSAEGMARYFIRLLRSYPKQTVEVEVQVPAAPRRARVAKAAA